MVPHVHQFRYRILARTHIAGDVRLFKAAFELHWGRRAKFWPRSGRFVERCGLTQIGTGLRAIVLVQVEACPLNQEFRCYDSGSCQIGFGSAADSIFNALGSPPVLDWRSSGWTSEV